MERDVKVIPLPLIFAERNNRSNSKLGEICKSLEANPVFASKPNLSVYVTGSYGRLEAGESSDIDVFFVYDDSNVSELPGKIEKIKIDYEIVKLVEGMGFPPFSNDGQYLEIHGLKRMKDVLGGSEDDYENHFTARMLLLLESKPICHIEAYNQVIDSILGSYFRDFNDHDQDFKPIFLINDIIRFWKTLCLNYEHRRNRMTEDPMMTVDPTKKVKNHIKNLKLKFRSLLFCFATVIYIMKRKAFTQDSIVEALNHTPIERLIQAFSEDTGKMEVHIDKCLDQYSWFLAVTCRSDVEEWFKIKENRDLAFEKADDFADSLYKLLVDAVPDQKLMRYLVM